MDVILRRGDLAVRNAGAVALGIPEGTKRPSGAAAAIDRATRGAIAALLASGDFTGKFLDTAVIHPASGKAKRVILVGLGPAAALTPHRARLAAAKAARRARELGARSLATEAFGAGKLDPAAAAQAAAEGAVLGHYRFSAYRSDPGSPPLARIEILEQNAKAAVTLKHFVETGAAWGEAVCLARDLANTPGQDLVPARLGERAKEIAAGTGARVQVLDVPQMERLGMGALLAVGRGSLHPPRFIVLEKDPAGARPAKAPRGKTPKRVPTVVLIGKGVTFDTGGLSLKPRENMHKMKYDMSGAAAVLGVFAALGTIDPPFRVVGLIPAAENMPSDRAIKPGDVVRAMGGTTIEITNTDAEGRLVLADALGYARRYQPEVVVDLATLTGAISIALGTLAAGLFTDDDALAAELTACGERTGERLWRMPLWDEYSSEMSSDTADLVNSAAREGGAILGAIFLKRFARGLRWAHLDIASTAWSASERAHEGRGPTGFGVRLLLEWLRQRSAGAS